MLRSKTNLCVFFNNSFHNICKYQLMLLEELLEELDAIVKRV